MWNHELSPDQLNVESLSCAENHINSFPAAAERDDILCWRTQRHYYNRPKRWLESALRDTSWPDKEEDNSKKRGDAPSAADGSKSPLWLGDELEFWPEKSGGKDPVRFVKIAALHSELVAVSASGHLYQWRWCDMTPFRGDNPSGTSCKLSIKVLT